MWTGIAIVALVIWIGISFAASSRKRITRAMKSHYSRDEAFELIDDTKRQAGFIFLIYGLILGVLFASLIKN